MNSDHLRQTPLDSRQLNAFASLARTGSFKETAGELCLTQSAISHAMRTLEREVGCRLLTRMCKRVVLTDMGEALLHHAEHGLQEFTKARETLDSLKKWAAPRLRIGAGAEMFRQLLAGLLLQVCRQHPRLLITARVVQPWEIIPSLQRSELEIVLGEPQAANPAVEFTPLFTSPLQVVVATSHRWAAGGRVTPGELPREPCLLQGTSHPSRQLTDRYFAAQQIVLNTVAEIDSVDAIKELVTSGIGFSVLPAWVAQEELAAGTLAGFPPGRRALHQTWGLHRWRNRPVSMMENSFQVLCKATARKFHTVT